MGSPRAVAPVDAILEALAAVPILAGVDAATLRRLAAHFDHVEVRSGTIVIRQGDPGDSFYVVRSGLLEVLREPTGGRIRLLRPGAPFGELALLSGTERVATVRAVRDTELWRLPHEAFVELLGTDAQFARMMVHALAQLVVESKAPTDAGHPRPRVFALLPLHEGAPTTPVLEVFASSFDDAVLCRESDAGPPAGWGRTVEHLEHVGRHVVLVASHDRGNWFAFCMREADRSIAVARADASFEPLPDDVRPDLLLFGRSAPGSTRRAVATLSARAHHVVIGDERDAIARALRRASGRSVGLVLSGGGARGLAHVGAYQALLDAGVAVDRTGGTSMGALVAALIASGSDPHHMRDVLHRELVLRRPFSDYGVPRASLIRAQRGRLLLDRLFGTMVIEDLPLDFFCISADLTSAETIVHRHGLVSGALGASMSLPGVAPPVPDGGRLLVDGGVLDNLPVETMTTRDEGPVIAVDVIARGIPRQRRASARRHPQLPSIVDTLARSATLASRGRADRQRALAAMVVTPDLQDVG
ncbi:MAG TPA: patatin-like phospholipase family protein, partial [Acidimicrobiales bacterium]|nr:patatin-like phospholipase family protein [Acidimicrobiales bacterium]